MIKFFKKIIKNFLIKKEVSTYQEPKDRINVVLNKFYQEYSNNPLPQREIELLPEILIPCYNHAKFLKRSIDLLKLHNVPITIIDDASDEENQTILLELCSTNGLKLLRNETNLLQFGSLNKAISQSKNNLFIISNADDLLLPFWIDYAINIFRKKDIALLGGHSVPFSIPDESQMYLIEILSSIDYKPKSEIKVYTPIQAKSYQSDNDLNMTMTGCTFLRSAWEYVDGFWPRSRRSSAWDDRDFQMRVNMFFNVGVSPEISAFYRIDSSTGRGTT